MPLLPTMLLFSLSPLAHATDLEWSGHYRARGLIYDSLSLSDSNSQAEGTSNLVDHRLRLGPRWYISERVAIFAQLDALNLEPWGASEEYWEDPVTGEQTYLAYSDTVVSPTTDEGASLPSSLALTRAWGEVYTDVGRLRFGRVPLHWGAGIYLNDGLAPDAEYGDTADRIQFTSRVGVMYLMGAWDVQHEGYLNDPDDMQSLNLAVAYRTEAAGIGLYNSYRYQPSQGFNAYTGDLWLRAELGAANLEAEVVGVYGSGNLESGANDIRISALGAMVNAQLRTGRIALGIEGGLATGDSDPDDENIHTFTFDRDHNLTLLLFEEPLPRLEAQTANETNEGLELDAVRTGEGIRNALYLRPHVGYEFLTGLQGDLSLFVAQAAKLPEEESEMKGYGIEIDANVSYDPYEHFTLSGTLGLLLPGKYFTEYQDDDFGADFNQPALGGRLIGTVWF